MAFDAKVLKTSELVLMLIGTRGSPGETTRALAEELDRRVPVPTLADGIGHPPPQCPNCDGSGIVRFTESLVRCMDCRGTGIG